MALFGVRKRPPGSFLYSWSRTLLKTRKTATFARAYGLGQLDLTAT